MTKKHILKPGRHQFVPGSHAVHKNDDFSDAEAEWYLKQYPHIAALFEPIPNDNAQPETDPEIACRVSAKETADIETPPDQIGEIATDQSV